MATIGIDDSEFTRGIARAETSIAGFGNKMKNIGEKAQNVGKNLSAKVTVPILAMGTAMFAAANSFDKAFNDIKVGTGAVGEKLEELKKDFKEVFKDLPGNAEVAAAAISNLNTLTGASGEVLQELTKGVLKASKMLGEDGVANSQAFGKALKQWGIDAEDGNTLLDKMFKITQDAGIGFNKLSDSLNTYGSVMKNANFTIEETSELFGKLDSAGIAVSRVMPGLNKAFRSWAKEGKNSRKELEKQVISIKKARTNTEALSIATDIFGAEGAQRMTTAIRNGSFELDNLGESLKGTEGLINRTDKTTRTFSDSMAIMRNKSQTSLAPLGDIILKLFNKALPFIEKFTNKVAELAESFSNMEPSKQKFVLATVGIIAAIGPVLLVMGNLIKTIGMIRRAFLLLNIEKLKDIASTIYIIALYAKDAVAKVASMVATKAMTVATKAMTVAQWLLNAAMSANPIALVIIAITALVVGIIYLWKTNEKFRKAVIKSWTSIKKFFTGLPKFFKKIWKDTKVMFTKIIDFFKKNWKEIGLFIVNPFAGAFALLYNNFDDFRNFIDNFVEDIKNFFTDLPGGISDVVQNIYNHFSKLGNNLSSWASTKIPELVKTIVDFISELPGDLWEELIKAYDKFTTWGINLVTWANDNISNFVKIIVDFIAKLPSKIWDELVKVYNKINEWGINLVTWANTNISNFVNTIVNFIASLSNKIWNELVKAYNKFVTWGNNLVSWANTNISNFVNTIVGYIAEVPNKMWKWLVKAYNKFLEWGEDLVRFGADIMPGFSDRIISPITKLPDKIWPWLRKSYDKVSEWGGDLMYWAGNTMPNFVGKIVSFVDELPSDMIGIGKDMATSLGDGISSKINWVRTKIGDFGSSVAGFFSGTISKMKRTGDDIVEALWDGINGATYWIKGKINDFIDNISRAFGDIGREMYNVGKNVVEGLWNGINYMASWIYNKVKDFIAGITNTAKNVLGIHSPSRVFADEVGKFIPQGITVGIDKEAPKMIENFKAKLGDMVASVSPKIKNGGQLATATAGISVENNMYGMDFSNYELTGQQVENSIERARWKIV